MPSYILVLTAITGFLICFHVALGKEGCEICDFNIGKYCSWSMQLFAALSMLAIMFHAFIGKSFLGAGIFGHLLIVNWKFALAGLVIGFICKFIADMVSLSE